MNREQLRAFEIATSGRNLGLFSAAGTGKTFVTKKIIEWAKQNNKNIGITSSTGTSAVTMGGRTLHSFLGIGLAQKSAYHLSVNTRTRSPNIISKLRDLDMLIIDEVSMISAELFDKVSEYLSIIRNAKDKPFGGVQLILSGDMCQLPPVNGEYPFQSNVWKELNLICIDFVEQVRQNNDEVFQKILSDARFGICSDKSLSILKSLKNPSFGEIEPTILYSKNVNVEHINQSRYNDLVIKGAKKMTYDSIFSKDKNTKAWAESLKIPSNVELCVGAQVMLTVNLSVEEGFANGSRGMITEFLEEGPVVLFKNGEQILVERWLFKDENDEEIWGSAIPLKLAYALTIHKSQSMTLDAAIIDLGPSIFECGQAYVALSRVRDMKSVKIINILKTSFKTNEEVIQFYNEIKLSQ